MSPTTVTPRKSSQPPPECACSVGREREVDELESLLLGSSLESVPVVVVHGRRGIGKTTLAAALAQRAGSRGIDVVWAAGSPLLEVPARSLIILDDACDVGAEKLERLAELIHQPTSARLLLLCRGARYRVRPRLAGWLDRVQNEFGCRFLMLRPVPSEAAQAMTRAACGGRASAETVADISRRTAGDPSLIKEFARVVRTDPSSDIRGTVPETVAGLVAMRLATLGENGRRVAEVGSLFTGEFALEWITAIVSLTEPEVLAALRANEDAGLVEQSGDDRFEISAPAVRDAIRSLIYGGHLQRAHRRLAEAMQALPAEAGSQAAPEIVRQYHSSRQLPGADRGVEPALEAAGQALAARSPLQAAELLELGLELCSGEHPALQARLTGALAKAWASALCHSQAVATLELACERMRAAGESSSQIAALVIEVAGALPLALTSIDASASERIHAIVGEVDERLAERIESVLNSQRPQITSPAQLHDRMVRIAVAGDDQRTAAVFRAAAETVEVLLDPALTKPLLQEARELGERLGSGAARSLAYTAQAVAAGRAGDLAGAGELARAAVRAQGPAGTRSDPPLAQLVELITELHSGSEWEHVAASATRLAGEHWSSPYATSLTAVAALARARAGDHERSRAALLEVVAALQPTLRYSSHVNAALGPAVEAAWRLNDVQLGERLLPVARRALVAGCGDFYMSQRDLTTARLALLAGCWEEARAAFGRAIEALGRAGELTLRATAEFEHEQALAANEAPSLTPDGLTRRQLEVLLLLSEGLTNQQIAERLVVSVNTVNRHVADIYRKIGASNRVGAAAYVARNDLSL